MDISLWISVPLAGLTALTIALHYYYKNAFKYWEKRGLKGPKPLPLIGNFARLVSDKDAPRAWVREYGKVYGIYEGSEPVLVVSDAAVLGQICVKDFNKFVNHSRQEFSSDMAQAFIFTTMDDHWRRVRSILSPTFTSGKMRRMFKLIDLCANDMIEAMQERINIKPVVNMKDLFGLYTMDAIASCCYGLRLMGYKSETSLTSASKRDEFVKLALKLFEFKMWRLLLIVSVNSKILKKLGVGINSRASELAFANKIEQIIKRRRESGKHFDDYLQTLIDSKAETIANNNNNLQQQSTNEDHLDVMERHHIGSENNSDEAHKYDGSNKILSDIEILSNASFLLVVGLETTAILLTNCFYSLSFHPEVQEKLYQTIKSLARFDEQNKVSFDYDSLTSCQYLDAVISETLRTIPSIPQTDRVASEDYYLKSQDLHVPKGTKVVLTLGTIMKDPDYWNEPEVFDPERFMPEQQHKIVPNSYCPFGIGPRHCFGMRFSLTESKIALAKLLMEFKFEPAPGTSYPPDLKQNFGLGNMKRPEVIVVKREEITAL